MTASVRAATAGALLAVSLLAAACGSSTAVAPVTPPAEDVAAAPTLDAGAGSPTAAPSVDPGSGGEAAPTPGGADVTGIDACTLVTQAEAEAALGVAIRAPFGSAVQGVNVRSCLFASADGNGPQVGVALSGVPDPFRPDLLATAPGPPYSGEPTAVPALGDEAWWWLDPRGFRLETRDGDRYIAFEFNDFRSTDMPTEAALGALVPLMRTALSRLP